MGAGTSILHGEDHLLTMPYCPECFTEYVDGSVECMDCRVPLRPGPPPARPAEDLSDVKLVRIRSFSGPTAQLDADLAKNILQEEGIPCVLPGEVAAEVLPGIGVVQLLVREEDAESASDLLKNYFDSQAASSDDKSEDDGSPGY